jgi:hypothetical protein
MTDEIIESEVSKLKPLSKKPKRNYKTFYNYQVKQFEKELERKLPNEFKGSISNYNHRSVGGICHIDDNVYNCFN